MRHVEFQVANAIMTPVAVLLSVFGGLAVTAMYIVAWTCLFVLWRRSVKRRFRVIDALPISVRSIAREEWPL